MTCKRAETLINLELDGRLDPADRAELQFHLDSCPRCRASLELQRQCRASLQLQSAELPADLSARLHRALEAARPAAGRAPVRFQRAAAALAAVLVLCLGLIGFSALSLTGAKGSYDNSGVPLDMAATESFAVQEEAPLASAPTTTAEAAAPAEATDTPAADDAPAEGVEQKSAQFNQPSSTGLPQESAEAEGETGEALSDKSDSAGSAAAKPAEEGREARPKSGRLILLLWSVAGLCLLGAAACLVQARRLKRARR